MLSQYADSRLNRHCGDGPLSLFCGCTCSPDHVLLFFLAHPALTNRRHTLNIDIVQNRGAIMQCFFLRRVWGVGGRLCFSLCWLRVCEFYVPCAHTSYDAFRYRPRSQLRVSPPQLARTLDSTVGTLGSTGGSCRAALGSINFIAYFYSPPLPLLCMHPPWHPSTSALTVHTAVKFGVSPCFMLACSSRLPVSLFESWCSSQHLRVFTRPFFFSLLMELSSSFWLW